MSPPSSDISIRSRFVALASPENKRSLEKYIITLQSYSILPCSLMSDIDPKETARRIEDWEEVEELDFLIVEIGIEGLK